jgi:hypothetical protein
VFLPLKPFHDVFPGVESAGVEYAESGDFETTTRRAAPYRQGDRERPRQFHSIRHGGGLIRCSNPLCRRGGYEFDLILSDMDRSKETERKGSMSCQGDEGSPKGRRRGSPCENKIEYTLSVRYK